MKIICLQFRRRCLRYSSKIISPKIHQPSNFRLSNMKNFFIQKRIVFISFFVLCKMLGFSQTNISGVVLDENNEPLPFVNILINESQNNGGSSDIDGKFKLTSTEQIRRLHLTFVGYEKLIYEIPSAAKNEKLILRMKASQLRLVEAVIVAGENPAHRIIRKVVKNRNRNNPERMTSFQCKTYNKVIVDLVPDEKGIEEFQEKYADSKSKLRKKQSGNFDKLMLRSEIHHMLLMESVTERQFLFPEKNSEHILHNRVSGFEHPSFASLANDFQPFSFYGDYIEILEKAYLNPVSPNSTRKYFFNIEDTLYQKLDTVFILSFHPRKGKNFEALEGLLYVNTNGYALQNVIAEPFHKSLIRMKMEQRYQLVQMEDEQQWFPEQLNFVFEASKYPHPSIGTRMVGKSYISEVQLNPPLTKKDFKLQGVSTAATANETADTTWQKYRPQVLSQKEKNTYIVIDSLGQKKHFDQMLNAMEALASGRFSVGKMDIHLNRILGFNDFEKTRIGLGLSTNENLSKYFELGAYGGFGTADEKWKYGSYLLLNFLPQKRLQLRLNYQKDLREPATLQLQTEPQIFSRQLYANRMDNLDLQSVELKGHLGAATQFNLSVAKLSLQPLYEYRFDEQDADFETFNFAEASLNLRFAFAEKIVRFLGTEVVETKYPLLLFSYRKGFKNWMEGDFNYQKVEFSLSDEIRVRNVGNTSLQIAAGWTQGKVPYNRLYATSGIGGGFQWFEIENIFQTMERYEFLSDQFIHLFVQHQFETPLFRFKKSRPELSLVQNMGWGKLENPELHLGIDFKTMEKGFFESGLRIDNLLLVNYFNFIYVGLGGGIYYRYGDYAFSTPQENLAYRFRLNFTW